MRIRIKRKLSLFLRLAVGLALLLGLFYKIGFKKVYETLISVNPYYILVIILTLFITIILGNLCLQILINKLNKKIKFWKLMKYYLLSWSLANFMPGKLGEFSMAYFLKRENIELGEGSVIILINKIITFIALFILAIFGFFIFFTTILALKLIFLFLGIFLILIFVIISNFGRNIIKKILRKHAVKFKGFYKTFIYYFKEQKLTLFWNFLLTLLMWIISGLMFAIYFCSLTTNKVCISLILVLTITATVTIISLIPISLSGLGLREISAVFLFGKVGVSSEIVISAYLVLLIIKYLLGGLFISFLRDR